MCSLGAGAPPGPLVSSWPPATVAPVWTSRDHLRKNVPESALSISYFTRVWASPVQPQRSRMGQSLGTPSSLASMVRTAMS